MNVIRFLVQGSAAEPYSHLQLMQVAVFLFMSCGCTLDSTIVT
jgi:hypothetical protein